MIISLEEAQEIYPDTTQAYLDGIEQAIRTETNNNFQNQKIRFTGLIFASSNTIVVDGLEGMSIDDTIQVSGSKWNNGLYIITGIDGDVLTVKDNARQFTRLFTCDDELAFITKIEYPSDIMLGVMKLLKYDAKTANTIGLKSKTVARMSETYFDQNSAEMIAGYPAALMSFIDKYRKMRW